MSKKKKSLFEKMISTVSRLPWLKGSDEPELKKEKLFKQVSPQTATASLQDLNEQEFEKLVHRLFIQRGYSVADKRDGAFDGVDLILQRNNESTYVQLQHWQQLTIDITELGEFYVAMEMDAVKHGIVITSGEFTAEALDFSLGKSLMLINGIDLTQMIEALPAETDEDDKEQLSNEAAEPEQQEMPELEPLCPICSQKMIKRTAKKGKNAGNTFWGCSKFPSCRGVISS